MVHWVKKNFQNNSKTILLISNIFVIQKPRRATKFLKNLHKFCTNCFTVDSVVTS